MSSLKKEMKTHFQTEDLYELFSVSKDASSAQIKRAYYKVSMKVHPDRVTEKETKTATIKFQIAGKAYSVLSDEEKRKIYDQTGTVTDDMFSGIKDWSEYFKSSFSFKNLDEFEKEYVGSEEEKEDLKKFYLQYKGNMDKITDDLFFYRFNSDDRVRNTLKDMIKKNEIPEYKTFTEEPATKIAARKKRYEKEAKAAEKHTKSLAASGKGDADLVAMIQQRQQERQGEVDAMCARFQNENGDDEEDEDSEDDEDFNGIEGDEVDESGSESEGSDDDDEDGVNGEEEEDDEDDDDDDEEDAEPQPKRTRHN